jgi:hypothetical protein
MTKRIFLLTTMTLVWALAAMTAKAAIIFQDDDFGTIDSDSIIIDADSDDLDLGNNQLSTFRFENVASLPGGAGGLGSGGAGNALSIFVIGI